MNIILVLIKLMKMFATLHVIGKYLYYRPGGRLQKLVGLINFIRLINIHYSLFDCLLIYGIVSVKRHVFFKISIFFCRY